MAGNRRLEAPVRVALALGVVLRTFLWRLQARRHASASAVLRALIRAAKRPLFAPPKAMSGVPTHSTYLLDRRDAEVLDQLGQDLGLGSRSETARFLIVQAFLADEATRKLPDDHRREVR